MTNAQWPSLKLKSQPSKHLHWSIRVIRAWSFIGHGARFHASASDATHRAAGRDKLRLSNVVTGLFLPDHLLKKIAQFLVRGATPQPRAQIVFHLAEKTGADIPVG